uniref:Ig-like domain-containing protein n=1 Tax=Erpetoichthys calabaricus TaxID=27687 RepID=A0A8C4RWV6_ERPCA
MLISKIFQCTLVSILLTCRLIISDSVTNTEKEVSITEGRAVTLNCSYSTTDSSPVLNWYRRYPNQAMQFILYKGARSSSANYKAEFARAHFSSTTGQYSTQLQISDLTLSDSAIYYCALRPTVLYSAQALNKISLTTACGEDNVTDPTE